ncbi:MAG: sigma-54 dependent transcriptional regulator [Nitrospirota bacterium]
MPRLDARVKTELPAWIRRHKGDLEEKVTIRDLSLSGLLLDGSTIKTSDTVLVKMALAKNNEPELFGDIVRMQDSLSAVRFYLPEQETLVRMWEFIKDRIKHPEICPYCNHENKVPLQRCEKCGWYINFKDVDYLKSHMRDTFLERISSRSERLSPENLQRVLHVIDRDLLATKGMSIDEYFIGNSKAMLEVFSLIRKVAPTENPVLILGESGTGKDLTAKAIHERSSRKSYPFMVINCTAIPEGLLEAELFGYEKGAFTGAFTSKKGKFELADGGTVFLDEIAELSISLQAKLLRVLEDKTLDRLGGKNGKKVDVRVITATNKTLEQEVADGRFRTDLYHRINTFAIVLPPLRDRGRDKEVIARYYLKKFCSQEGVSKQFSKEAIESIMMYPWPGNVRELINKIRRAIVVSQSDVITPADLSLEVTEISKISPLREVKAHIEKQNLIGILEMTSHNISKTAKFLGVSRPTVYALIKKYGLESSGS